MSHTPRTSCAAAAAGVCAATLSVAALAATASAATPNNRAFGGSAYGSAASVGTVRSGATAAVPLCTTKVGASNDDKTAAVTLPGVGKIGAVTTRVRSTGSGSAVASIATTSTASTSLLGGLVRASAITTQSTVSHTASGYATKAITTVTGLRVGGAVIATHPGVGQSITLPGVGKVVLNQQVRDNRYGGLSLAVTALRVDLVAGNTLHLPAGTVIVGHAQASLHTPTHRLAYGNAYGTTVEVGTAVKSGRTAAVYLPCGGSNGSTRSNSTASAVLPAVLSVGAVTSSERSVDTAKATTAITRAHIADVSLLGGVVRLSGVTAQATATRTAGGIKLSSTGTTVAGLTIQGHARTITVKPNTKIVVAGIGVLYLDRVVRTGQSVRVHAVELDLTQAHGKTAKATVITVGAALAGVVN